MVGDCTKMASLRLEQLCQLFRFAQDAASANFIRLFEHDKIHLTACLLLAGAPRRNVGSESCRYFRRLT